MEKLIRKDYSLGEVVTVYPAVVKKFNDMELDYCCGGNKSLELALKEKGVEVSEIMTMPYGKMFSFKDQDGNDYLVREDK